MAHPGYIHLWQQAHMSDVEIVISVAEDISPAGDDDPKAQYSTLTPLQQIPGHSLSQILSPSPYSLHRQVPWL
jgi:hypothetical protein